MVRERNRRPPARTRVLAFAVAMGLVAACGKAGDEADGGGADGSVVLDGGSPAGDAGPPRDADAGPADSGPTDGQTPDAAAPDSAPPDAAAADAGPMCGNGVRETGEACDEGPDNSDTDPDACRTDCETAHCGDGVVDTAEECDDENAVDDDECRNDCTLPDPLDRYLGMTVSSTTVCEEDYYYSCDPWMPPSRATCSGFAENTVEVTIRLSFGTDASGRPLPFMQSCESPNDTCGNDDAMPGTAEFQRVSSTMFVAYGVEFLQSDANPRVGDMTLQVRSDGTLEASFSGDTGYVLSDRAFTSCTWTLSP